jgi:hypothetical protein
VRQAVGALPGLTVPEPEVRAEVDHLGLSRQLLDQVGGRAVRQRQEDQFGPAEGLRGGLGETPAGVADQVRVQFGDRPASAAVRGHRLNVQARVTGQQPQQLPAGVPTGPGHRYWNSHAGDYARR